MTINSLAIIFSTKMLPFAYALIGFSFLITIHEFGHFLFCKLFKIHTPTFSIGMGPKILEKKIGNTNFRLSAIPLGGYVEIAGLSEVGQGDQSHAQVKDESSFASKSYWKKFLVLSGGVMFNLLFAYIVYSILFFAGIPKKTATFNISEKAHAEILEQFNLEPGDIITHINNIKLNNDPKILIESLKKELINPLTKNENQEIDISLQTIRNNRKSGARIKINSNDNIINNLINSFQIKTEELKGQYEKYPLPQAIIKGIQTTNNWIKQMAMGIIYLIKERNLSGAGGPIMILSKTFETAQKGIIPLLIFLAFISINLAIINILPIGALDGGQLLFATIESIIRREIPEIIKTSINIASWVALLSLILYLSYKDILNLFIK